MKLKVFIITVLSALLITTGVGANDSIKLKVNGIDITAVAEPLIIEGRTMVPVRAIFESLGSEVSWDSETKTITGKNTKAEVIMQIGSRNFFVNGIEKKMDSAPVIIDGRTLAPARYVAESLGFEVDWDSSSRTVNIKLKSGELTTEATTAFTTEATTTEATTIKIAESTSAATTEIYLKDISHTLKEQIKSDTKTAIGNYSLGNARKISRFTTTYKNNLFAAWASLAQSDTDKIYIENAKKFYNSVYSVMLKLDDFNNAHPNDENLFPIYKLYKDKINQVYIKFAECEKVSHINELITEFNTMKKEIQDYINTKYKN